MTTKFRNLNQLLSFIKKNNINIENVQFRNALLMDFTIDGSIEVYDPHSNNFEYSDISTSEYKEQRRFIPCKGATTISNITEGTTEVRFDNGSPSFFYKDGKLL